MTELVLMRRHDGSLQPADDETWTYIDKLAPGELIMAKVRVLNVGTSSMLRTWMMWMRTTARAMAGRGARMPLSFDREGNWIGLRRFNQHDAHELFTHKYMGADDAGNRYSWKTSGELDPDETPASHELRLYAMDRHVEYCADRAIKIVIPRKSEYRQSTEAQND